MVADVVETHAVGAADEHAGIGDFLADAFPETRFGVVVQHQRGHDDGGRYAGHDCRIECRFDARVTDTEDDEVRYLGQVGEGRIATHLHELAVTGIDGEDAAPEAAAQEIPERPLAERVRLARGTHHGDRGGPQQGIETMLHRESVQNGPGGVAPRRGGNQNGLSTTVAFAITRDQCISRW